MIPFTINGARVDAAILCNSSTDFLPAGGVIFFKNGSPAASTSIATANAPESSTNLIFSLTVSKFQGFTVGIPMPADFLIASVAHFITSALTPSPVIAAIPALAQAETSTSL